MGIFSYVFSTEGKQVAPRSRAAIGRPLYIVDLKGPADIEVSRNALEPVLGEGLQASKVARYSRLEFALGH